MLAMMGDEAQLHFFATIAAEELPNNITHCMVRCIPKPRDYSPGQA